MNWLGFRCAKTAAPESNLPGQQVSRLSEGPR
jgi:hypothetical protein